MRAPSLGAFVTEAADAPDLRLEMRTPRPVLWFRRHRSGRVAWILRALMIITILSSLWNLYRVTDQAAGLYGLMEEIRDEVVVQNSGAYPALIQDAVRLLSGTVLFAMIMVLLAVAILPVRYAFLLWAVGGSSPATYRTLRVWSVVLIAVEAMRLLFWLSLVDQYESIVVTYTPSPNGILGLTLLGYSQMGEVREQFNVFRLKQQPIAKPVPNLRAPPPDDGWLQETDSGDPAQSSWKSSE